jgi:hypothetical protein
MTMIRRTPDHVPGANRRDGLACALPKLANDPQHDERIDAHIIAELKRCRFAIADVTFAAAGV